MVEEVEYSDYAIIPPIVREDDDLSNAQKILCGVIGDKLYDGSVHDFSNDELAKIAHLDKRTVDKGLPVLEGKGYIEINVYWWNEVRVGEGERKLVETQNPEEADIVKREIIPGKKTKLAWR